MRRPGAGYTLVELILAMLVFSVVMGIISNSFSSIVKHSSQLMKSAESDVGGLIGLELFRRDLELAGIGLPYLVPDAVLYSEALDDLDIVHNCPGGCPQARPSLYDDRTNLDAPNTPSPFRFGNDVGYGGSDYLVIKGSALGMSRVSRDWCYLGYSSGGATVRTPPGESELSPGDDSRVIVLKSGASGGSAVRELVTNGASFWGIFDEPQLAPFAPRERGDSRLVYGIGDKDTATLRFPFNRADYYISRPEEMASSCAPKTGVLYKSVITHGGGHTPYRLLDCVADLQAVFFWDTSEDGAIDYSSEVIEEVAGTPQELRARLKEVRVYVLAQEGRFDPAYRYPVTDPRAAIVVGDAKVNEKTGKVLGRVWTESQLIASFGSNWRNYRWRLYTIVVQPKNL